MRSRMLVRIGMLFDELMARAGVPRRLQGIGAQTRSRQSQKLRDVDTVREFLTGPGLIAFCDAPWIPIFILAAFLIHPLFGVIAIVGGIVTLRAGAANEIATKDPADAEAGIYGRRRSASRRSATPRSSRRWAWSRRMQKRWSRHQRQGARVFRRPPATGPGAIIAFTKFFRIVLQTMILRRRRLSGGPARDYRPGMMIAASIMIGRALQPIEVAVGNWKGFPGARDGFRPHETAAARGGAEPERDAAAAPARGA